MSGKGWLRSSIGPRSASKMPRNNGSCSSAQKGIACQQDVMITNGLHSKPGHVRNPVVSNIVSHVFPWFPHFKKSIKPGESPPKAAPGHTPASQAHGSPCRCCSSIGPLAHGHGHEPWRPQLSMGKMDDPIEKCIKCVKWILPRGTPSQVREELREELREEH